MVDDRPTLECHSVRTALAAVPSRLSHRGCPLAAVPSRLSPRGCPIAAVRKGSKDCPCGTTVYLATVRRGKRKTCPCGTDFHYDFKYTNHYAQASHLHQQNHKPSQQYPAHHNHIHATIPFAFHDPQNDLEYPNALPLQNNQNLP